MCSVTEGYGGIRAETADLIHSQKAVINLTKIHARFWRQISSKQLHGHEGRQEVREEKKHGHVQ